MLRGKGRSKAHTTSYLGKMKYLPGAAEVAWQLRAIVLAEDLVVHNHLQYNPVPGGWDALF